jgi:glycosyltransferase involved in cell wall biosynthesis
MMTVLEALLFVSMMVVAAPALLLLLQVLLAWRGARADRQADAPPPFAGRLAVLMPAHDEAQGIATTIAALRPQLLAQDRLLVVADNCGDDTAQRAREAGATVVERRDAQHRGKGYALAFGMTQLAGDPPDVVILVDADCLVQPGALQRLAAQAQQHQCPIQAHYRMDAPSGAGLMTRVSALAWRVKTLVRPLGWRTLGLPCPLMGSGMAFPWALLVRFELGSAHLVEDLQLGLDLTRAGAAPRFEPTSEVRSTLPASARGSRTQRTRWEHGHLGVLLHTAPRLLGQAVGERSGALLAVAADLVVPPLALLALLLAAASSVSLGAWLLLGWTAPFVLALVACASFATAVLIAWARFGRDTLSARDLASAPLYVLWKIPVYLGFVLHRQRAWVRTEREPPR